MKIFGLISSLLVFLLVHNPIISQEIDCLTKLKMRQAAPSFKLNEQSKSAICRTGEKYEYNIQLQKKKLYRLSFFASSVFNNKINFKILNITTGELLINLPGVSLDNVKGCALEEYFDESSNKMVHPFFEYSPSADTRLKIIIEVEDENGQQSYHTKSLLASNDQKSGCVTVFIQSKEHDGEGFM